MNKGWAPITEAELIDKITLSLDRMTPDQRRLWEIIKIEPVKWELNPEGAIGGGFWVVAIYGQKAIWYNDIEEGFNESPWTTPGFLNGYLCEQDELQWVVQKVIKGKLMTAE